MPNNTVSYAVRAVFSKWWGQGMGRPNFS